MASDKDPYEILGVPRDATLEQIRRKYRKLLRKFHPDVVASDGDPEMLDYSNRMTAEINAAFETLSDSRRRSEYDSAHRPPEFVVSDVAADIEVTEGEEAVVRFKVDNRGGQIPAGGQLIFSPRASWLKLRPVKIQSVHDESTFPMVVELLVDTEGLDRDIWHETEIEVCLEEG